jgi:hypothetical protein
MRRRRKDIDTQDLVPGDHLRYVRIAADVSDVLLLLVRVADDDGTLASTGAVSRRNPTYARAPDASKA